jgi:O-antigen/teichoic acid export membrane protein
MNLIALVLGGGYFVVMALHGSWLLTHIFGSSFARFDELIWPMATMQLLGAGSFAFAVLLIAERRGRTLVGVAIVGSTATFVLATGFGALTGVIGAAWGFAAAAGVSAIVVTLAAQLDYEKRDRLLHRRREGLL